MPFFFENRGEKLKKIFISLLAIIIFIAPIHNAMYPQYADAAVASKAATLAAKQALKEVVKDAAVESVTNFALMEAMDIVNKYESKPGYKAVCLEGGSNCSKPVQIKEMLTETDKANIAKQADTELEKLITPDGKGFTKFQKFLDWFAPVWLVSFGATALTYALDGDVRDLINEAAYNSLVSLGLVSPLTSLTEANPLGDYDFITPTKDGNTLDADGNITAVTKIWGGSEKSTGGWATAPYGSKSDHVHAGSAVIDGKITNLKIFMYNNTWFDIYKTPTNFYVRIPTNYFVNNLPDPKLSIKYKNVLVHENLTGTTNGSYYDIQIPISSPISIDFEKVRSVRNRLPYKIGDTYYTDALMYTPAGDKIEFQYSSKSLIYKDTGTQGGFNIYTDTSNAWQNVSAISTVHANSSWKKKIMVPTYEEVTTSGIDPMAYSSYEDGTGKVAVLPPSAMTYQEETTGEQVYKVPNATGDGSTFEKTDGTPVPEDSVVTGPAPVVTKNPEGVPQYTPTPTPSSPTPSPQPLTPSPTPSTPQEPHPGTETPPTNNPPPPVETTEPYFPEGENCSEGLKIPKFLPLLNTISETFPFSIPFDLYGGFEALFINMGKERPEFKFEFDVMGKQQSWDIALPPMFDEWKKFTDSLLIFLFDIGIIWAIFRFTGGGK